MGTNNFNDNSIHERGYGKWLLHVYNPSVSVGPIEGILTVGKDFHTIMNEDSGGKQFTIASFPSQNVAYVLNCLFPVIAELGTTLTT